MKFVVAPDKFKGCLSARAVAEAITAGIMSVVPYAQVDQCPIADGGEGTVDALLKARGGRLLTRRVTGPLPEMKVDASFALLADGVTAVIEMAAASGLALLKPEDRNPLNTTTFGTGELIVAAIREGAKKIILGLGGSATNDAGIGCAQACGFTVLLKDGEPTFMTEPLCGRDLSNVLMVKHGRGEVTAGIEIIGATDVTNRLLGENGAARVFGPQKGATRGIIQQLDDALQQLSHRTGTELLANHPGAGAAGGFGYGILAFMSGKLASGFNIIAAELKLRERLKGAQLCITGEGRLDLQTAQGKTVGGIASLCLEQNIPCVALVGAVTKDFELSSITGLTAYCCIGDASIKVEESYAKSAELLVTRTAVFLKIWIATQSRRLNRSDA